MKATTPPRAWASARTCWQTVVLPDDSGPKISVIRPRGMPPTPSARSSAIEPVGMVSRTCFSRDPSFMIAPRPNCFSIVARAASTALPRSAVVRVRPLVLPSSPSVRHAPHPIHVDRSPERTLMASAGRSAFLRRRPRRPCRSLRGLRITSTFCGGSDSGDRLGWAGLLPSASSSLCSVDLASPSLRLRVVQQTTDRSFTPTSRRLHRHLPGPREGAVRTSRQGRFRPGSRLGSWP